jgi:prefoldin subunit 5
MPKCIILEIYVILLSSQFKELDNEVREMRLAVKTLRKTKKFLSKEEKGQNLSEMMIIWVCKYFACH